MLQEEVEKEEEVVEGYRFYTAESNRRAGPLFLHIRTGVCSVFNYLQILVFCSPGDAPAVFFLYFFFLFAIR